MDRSQRSCLSWKHDQPANDPAIWNVFPGLPSMCYSAVTVITLSILQWRLNTGENRGYVHTNQSNHRVFFCLARLWKPSSPQTKFLVLVMCWLVRLPTSLESFDRQIVYMLFNVHSHSAVRITGLHKRSKKSGNQFPPSKARFGCCGQTLHFSTYLNLVLTERWWKFLLLHTAHVNGCYFPGSCYPRNIQVPCHHHYVWNDPGRLPRT